MGNGQHHLHPYIQLNTRLYIRIGVYCIISTLCIVIHRMFPIYYPIWEIFNNLIHSLYTVYNVHCMTYSVCCTMYIVWCTQLLYYIPIQHYLSMHHRILYYIHYTVYSIQCTVYSIHYTVYIVHDTYERSAWGKAIYSQVSQCIVWKNNNTSTRILCTALLYTLSTRVNLT